MQHGTSFALKLIIPLVVGAGIILWSILPRFDRFQPPGPRLIPEEQPEPFEMIAALSLATGEEIPANVYLTGDVNAFVAQRAEFLGLAADQ